MNRSCPNCLLPLHRAGLKWGGVYYDKPQVCPHCGVVLIVNRHRNENYIFPPLLGLSVVFNLTFLLNLHENQYVMCFLGIVLPVLFGLAVFKYLSIPGDWLRYQMIKSVPTEVDVPIFDGLLATQFDDLDLGNRHLESDKFWGFWKNKDQQNNQISMLIASGTNLKEQESEWGFWKMN
ncbi:hypothetical protein [Teredinibacter sp. KSP-S5-2]|uniref:hypothetical protein n=1 Tax=Teredinibacter sp. KSP-S5-2 TaxID=3034506 RepID=UPI002934EF8F|nr:hypothetical protein [Teredinibacter sp. KSP-S5-2]WNO09070.1 hypothetical protein P5V12_19180 [Teredinibacter sp. KSP-S5-2]